MFVCVHLFTPTTGDKYRFFPTDRGPPTTGDVPGRRNLYDISISYQKWYIYIFRKVPTCNIFFGSKLMMLNNRWGFDPECESVAVLTFKIAGIKPRFNLQCVRIPCACTTEITSPIVKIGVPVLTLIGTVCFQIILKRRFRFTEKTNR